MATQTEFADHVGLTKQAVSELKRRGVIHEGGTLDEWLKAGRVGSTAQAAAMRPNGLAMSSMPEITPPQRRRGRPARQLPGGDEGEEDGDQLVAAQFVTERPAPQT